MFEGALALISCIIGGGIVSIPYAILSCGVPLAVFLNISCAGMGYLSGLLFMKAKMMAPVPVLTLYELGYLAFGKWCVYPVSFIAILSNIGCVIIYLIIYGDLASSLSLQVFFKGK